MVDNRSAGFYGIGGSFNFKSGDPSGTAAKMSQDKYGSEAMYMAPAENEEEADILNNQQFVDRSALLRATLNSLAMSNVASVINANKHKKDVKDIQDVESDEKMSEDDENSEQIIKKIESSNEDSENSENDLAN